MESIYRRTVLRGGVGLSLAPLGAMLMAAAAGKSPGAADVSTPGAAGASASPSVSGSGGRHPFELEFLYHRVSKLRAPVIVGPTPTGLRVNIHTEGGEFEGPRLRGKVLPGFGDALVIRKDGVGIIDSRTTMQTDDGAIIFVNYMGVVDFGEGSYEKFLAGAPPQIAKLHVGPRFDTAHPAYAWLNRIQGIGIGRHEPAASTNVWDFYGIR